MDQQMLAKTVVDYGKKDSPVERFRRLRDAEGCGYERSTWKVMGELGWLGVAFPESVGGFGGSFVECALVLENLALRNQIEVLLRDVKRPKFDARDRMFWSMLRSCTDRICY